MKSLHSSNSSSFWFAMTGAILAAAITGLAGWSLGIHGREPQGNNERLTLGPTGSDLQARISELKKEAPRQRTISAAGLPKLARSERQELLRAIYLAGPEDRASALARLGLAPSSADYEQLLDACSSDGGWQDREKAAQANALLREWLALDAVAVFAYVEAQASQPIVNQLVGWLRDALASLDAERALELALDSLTGDRRAAMLSPLAGRIVQEDAERAIEIFEMIDGECYRGEAVNCMANVLAANDSALALAWAKTLPEEEFRDNILAAVAYQMVKQDPLQALDLSREIASESYYVGSLSSIVREWSDANFANAADFVDGLPAGRYRDAAQVELVMRLMNKREIYDAWGRALSIGDPTVRENMLSNVAANSVVLQPKMTDQLLEEAARTLGESAYQRLLERVDERRRLSK